jgi:hypothetical protein
MNIKLTLGLMRSKGVNLLNEDEIPSLDDGNTLRFGPKAQVDYTRSDFYISGPDNKTIGTIEPVLVDGAYSGHRFSPK